MHPRTLLLLFPQLCTASSPVFSSSREVVPSSCLVPQLVRLGSPSSPPLLAESSVTSVSSLAQKVQQAVTTPNHRRGGDIRGRGSHQSPDSIIVSSLPGSRLKACVVDCCRLFSLHAITVLPCLSAAASFSFIFAAPRVAGLRKFYPDLCCQDHHPLILHTHPVAKSSRYPKCLTRPKVS